MRLRLSRESESESSSSKRADTDIPRQPNRRRRRGLPRLETLALVTSLRVERGESSEKVTGAGRRVVEKEEGSR